jgi:putative tricarboxylic transport membrane protein
MNAKRMLMMHPAAVALPLLLVTVSADAASSWKPNKAVELIAQNAPGGGSDRVSRIMTTVLHDRRQIEMPITVVNKPGAGGSVAAAYLNQHPGDAHYVLLAGKPLLINSITGNGPSHTQYTQLALLFSEYIAVTVRPDSPLRSGKDLVDRLKKDPGSLSFGIATSLGSPNHQAVAAALKEAGVDLRKMRTVMFPSGGAASVAMQGGHVDVVPISVSFAASLLRQGQVRLLAVSAPNRIGNVLADVPTWRELGHQVVVSNWRSLWGAKGLNEAHIAYWEQAMRNMVESQEWKKELDTNFWMSEFLPAGDTRKFLDRDYAETRAFLTDLGLAK